MAQRGDPAGGAGVRGVNRPKFTKFTLVGDVRWGGAAGSMSATGNRPGMTLAGLAAVGKANDRVWFAIANAVDATLLSVREYEIMR